MRSSSLLRLRVSLIGRILSRPSVSPVPPPVIAAGPHCFIIPRSVASPGRFEGSFPSGFHRCDDRWSHCLSTFAPLSLFQHSSRALID